jgi:hypothetical protein
MVSSSISNEAGRIVRSLTPVMPRRVDGRKAILTMRNDGSSHWRQMEWIGFWFEHLVENEIKGGLGVSVGPTVGRTTFDLVIDHVWDLKVHPRNPRSKYLILNDREAVDRCIDEYGGFGVVVVSGSAEYDESGEFKLWHDDIKGGRSSYEAQRIERGAPSRRRKIAFEPDAIKAVFFESHADIARGLKEKWLGFFQEGMRNSNGHARRAKYQIKLETVPDELVVARASF